MQNYSQDYLLDKKVKIFQPLDGYRASTDAVFLSALLSCVKPHEKILDVGSGTGAISLCLAERFKNKNISITGLEIQPELAELSNISAKENGFDFVKFINTDIAAPLPDGLQFCSFNHVISNPPYALLDMPSPNKSKATAHNFSTLSLFEWIGFCIKMLAPQGKLYLINRAEALDDILFALHKKTGNIHVIPLFSKPEQTQAKRVLISAQKDSKAPLVIHSGIVIHNDDGQYTTLSHRVLRLGEPLDLLND